MLENNKIHLKTTPKEKLMIWFKFLLRRTKVSHQPLLPLMMEVSLKPQSQKIKPQMPYQRTVKLMQSLRLMRIPIETKWKMFSKMLLMPELILKTKELLKDSHKSSQLKKWPRKWSHQLSLPPTLLSTMILLFSSLRARLIRPRIRSQPPVRKEKSHFKMRNLIETLSSQYLDTPTKLGFLQGILVNWSPEPKCQFLNSRLLCH